MTTLKYVLVVGMSILRGEMPVIVAGRRKKVSQQPNLTSLFISHCCVYYFRRQGESKETRSRDR